MTNKEMLKYLVKKMETVDKRLTQLEKKSRSTAKKPVRKKKKVSKRRTVRVGKVDESSRIIACFPDHGSRC